MVLAVLSVMAAALTLLPAVLGFAGRNIDRLRVPGITPGDGRSEHWAHWSRRVQRRPVLAGVAALAVLLTLAAPVFGMRFGYPDAGTGGKGLGSRKAFDLIEQGFGPGANGPLTVVVAAGGTDARVDAATASVTRALTSTDGVAAVLPAMVDTTGTAAALTVVPATGPQDSGTESLVHHLRDDVLPAATEGTSVRAVVGGATALYIDEAAYEGSHLPYFLATVIVVSFVLLMCVFRSLLVALKAALLNVLAISAAYGVIALASHGGWLGQLIGIEEPTPIPVFVPILMFALLFGLSMDYEVFLLSRIREEHLSGHRNSDAVAEGIANTARVITAAAAIMVMVFGAFVFADVAFMKLAGLGMATAVFVDATIVRMVLVPATMEVLGERNWWMPRWLDRILPNIDVEGDPIPVAVAPAVAAAVSESEAEVDGREPALV
jgi:RND superfamily putative drug exporter